MHKDLEAALAAVRTIPAEELVSFIGELEQIRASAWARLLTPPPPPQHDELLDVEAAAQRLGVSTDYVYHHAGSFPFTRRQGRKLLFSTLEIDTYLRTKRGV
jgi:excisionase family DNA binding protein